MKLVLVVLAGLMLFVPPRAAVADDALHVVGGQPGGIEVLENVARYAGLYKAEHLDVDNQYAGSAAGCAQVVASGKGDLCSMSIEPIILGYAKGVRLQVFFSRVLRYDYLLAVLDDSPIRTLADFKGASIGEPAPGSATEIAANDMLEGAGLRPADYAFTSVGVGGAALSALVSKKIDALADSAVEVGTLGAAAHLKFRLFRDPILDSIPNVGFAARPDVIQAKADVLRRYARAMVKASLLIRENPALAAHYALMGENVGTGITPDALRTETAELESMEGDLAGANPANPRIGYTGLTGVALYCAFFQNAGRTSALVPASAIVTNQFIAYANDFDKKAWIAHVRTMTPPR